MTTPSRQPTDENELIARYLAGQLSDREREDFEALLLENPELLKELDRTAQFKSGLMSLQKSGALQKLLQRKPWWQRGGSYALAASILVAVVGAGLWFKIDSPRPILAASTHAFAGAFQAALPLGGSYTIQRTRSSSYDATIKSPSAPSAIELRIKPETAASPGRYRIALGIFSENGSVKPVTTISQVQAESDGFVPVYLNPSELVPAVYEIKISGDSGTTAENTESSFLIEITGAS